MNRTDMPAPGRELPDTIRRGRPSRRIFLPLADACAIAVAWLLVVGSVAGVPPRGAAGLLVAALVAQLSAGYLLSLYRERFVVGSAHEARRQGYAGLVVVVVAAIASWALQYPGEISRPVLAMLAAQVLMALTRQGLRLRDERLHRPRNAHNVVIVGAGELGRALVAQMQRDSESRYRPVAIVDDDPAKAHLLVHGVPVCGPTSHVEAIARAHAASGVIVAIAHAPARIFEQLIDELDPHLTWVRTVPTVNELLDGTNTLAELRDVDVGDLIGRAPVTADGDDIAGLVAGRVVLVTGAGGSIGSELCRVIHRHGPQRLIMLDRDESELHALCMTLQGRAMMDSPDLVLADIRDFAALDRVFALHRPHIVVHAAALKHLPMLEQYPQEGWKTNVHGTLNVLRAARAHRVERFVNISTDKAANPSSELGRSKFTAERLTAHFAEGAPGPYVSVRFGNVLGSRGSVLISFSEQIRRGGPVTITHPDVTRYFMSIPEACALVLQAAAHGSGGQTLVLDMGKPVRIVDLARRAMALYGRTCPIEFTGLRAGEKLHEELFSPEELGRGALEGGDWHVAVAPLDPALLDPPHAAPEAVSAAYASITAPAPAPAPSPAPSQVPSPVPAVSLQAPAARLTAVPVMARAGFRAARQP